MQRFFVALDEEMSLEREKQKSTTLLCLWNIFYVWGESLGGVLWASVRRDARYKKGNPRIFLDRNCKKSVTGDANLMSFLILSLIYFFLFL